jgi:hypothetical protein
MGLDVISDDDAEKALEFLKKSASAYAKAKAERIWLDEFRKSKKAILMKQSGDQSAAAQERDAYAHPEYQELLQGLKVAVENEENLRWKIASAELQISIWQTQSANSRKGI